jgi:hypothetical protein
MNKKVDQEEFYRLTPFISRKLRAANLSAAEWRFWAYLTEHDRWGNGYKSLDSFDVMTECGMSKATYYRAKAKFQEEGLFDFQEGKVSFRNLNGNSRFSQNPQKPSSTEIETSTEGETSFSKMRQAIQKCDSQFKNESPNSEMRQDIQKCENESLEPASCKASETPQTLKTYSDLLKTLSEGMRESFEKFCLKKIEECPFKIGSRKAWLNKHGAEYLQEFNELYAYAISNPEVIAPKAEIATPTIEQLKQQYGPGWKNAAIHFGLISPNSPTVENQEVNPSW